jgi:hypothetical protein
MGNDPINKLDPDGGCTDPACIAAVYQTATGIGLGLGVGIAGVFIGSAYIGSEIGGPIIAANLEQMVDGIAGLLLKLNVPARSLYPSSVLDIDGQLLNVVGDVSIVSDVLHGNSKNNPNSHIVYEIYGHGADGRETLKFGIADQKYNTYNGKGNSRPQSQLAELRAKYPHLVISYVIWSRTQTRMEALFVEGVMVTNHVIKYGKMPDEQKLPLPFKN